MKTAREWFKELPDDIEKMAVENAENAPVKLIDNEFFKDLPDSLTGSFIWLSSPQGQNFWQNVYDQHCEE